MDYHEKKLERAEKAAEEIWKAQYQPEKTETETKTEEKTEAETGETPEVTEGVAETTTETVAAEVIAEETTEEPKKVEPKKEEPKSDTTLKISPADWEKKYQTLKGKYDAEIPRKDAEVGQWRDYATSLQNRITALEEASKAPPKKEEPETDPDVEALATDYPDVAKIIKRMEAKHTAEMAALRRELETGVNADIKTVKSDLQVTRQERFDLAMKAAGVPDWQTVDRDPAFIEWLNTPVPYTKATKLQLLQEAARNLDTDTTSQFFLDFKASMSPVGETPLPEQEPQPDKLSKFTAPPRGGGPTPPKKPVQAGLTWDQYRKFMDPRQKFNPAEYGGKNEAQVEAMFDAAIQKGTLV